MKQKIEFNTKIELSDFIKDIVKTAMNEAKSESKVAESKDNERNIIILKEIESIKLVGLISKVYNTYKKYINKFVEIEYDGYKDGKERRLKGIFIETNKLWDKTYGTIFNAGIIDIITGNDYIQTTFGCSRSNIQVYKNKDKSYIEFNGNDLDAVSVAFALSLMNDMKINAYDILIEYLQYGFNVDTKNIDITGCEDIIKRCNSILRCKDSRIVNRHILLYGTPGNGKSMLAKRIAFENKDYTSITINVQNKWEQWIPMLSEVVQKTKRKLLIIFDEIDELGLNRDNNRDRVYALLRLLDGTTDLKNIKFIATTNRPKDLDVALLRTGRFSPIFMPSPDNEQRRKVIKYYLDKYSFNGINVDNLISKMHDNISCASLRGCIEDCIINDIKPTESNIIDNLKNHTAEIEKISNLKDLMFS